MGCDQPSGPIKLTWRQGRPAPVVITASQGSAVVHGSTAYFSNEYCIYSYSGQGTWTELPQCKYEDFAMAIVNDALTTIGGWDFQGMVTNTLLSLSGSKWEEVLPPMPTEKRIPAAATTPTHLVVAGGLRGDFLETVEVLNTETLQWSTTSSLPEVVLSPKLITCGECLYLADDDSNVFSCSMEDILKSTNSSDGGSVWTRLASIPTTEESALATLEGHVVAIGGKDGDNNPTRAIRNYDAATNSWSIISEMPTPRSRVLAAVVLPSNELVVVGGWEARNAPGRYLSCITEIGRVPH